MEAILNTGLFVAGDISLNGRLWCNYPDNTIPSSAIENNLNNGQNQTLLGDKLFKGVINSTVVTFPDSSVISSNATNYDGSLFAMTFPGSGTTSTGAGINVGNTGVERI